MDFWNKAHQLRCSSLGNWVLDFDFMVYLNYMTYHVLKVSTYILLQNLDMLLAVGVSSIVITEIIFIVKAIANDDGENWYASKPNPVLMINYFLQVKQMYYDNIIF